MSNDEIERLLADLLAGIQQTLAERLVGFYLYGSLATGGFEPGISDIDLLAATADDITPADLVHLREMHAEIVRSHPAWDDRIEVLYYSVESLGKFKEHRGRIAVISPGEPLHVREEGAGADWLMNWHLITHGGRMLFGPDPRGFITPTTNDEFIDSLVDHLQTSDEWIASARNRKAQSYVVLTVCRTLVAIHTGEHSSKREAAEWVAGHFPEWAGLTQRAIARRLDPTSAGREDPGSSEDLEGFAAFVRKEAELHRHEPPSTQPPLP
jgi:predicted nucleotidyltransferase